MVPLAGENALLVKRGLTALAGANGPGLAELLKAARVEGAVRAQHIGFGVGPRINAVGRMGGAEDAVRLLLTRDPGRGRDAHGPGGGPEPGAPGDPAGPGRRLPPPGDAPFDLVVEPDAHKGVIGIVAGQRMRASRPPLGGRHRAGRRGPLLGCAPRRATTCGRPWTWLRPYLLAGGGHRCAAGLTFPAGRLGFIRKTLERVALEQAAGRRRPRPCWWTAPAPAWRPPRPSWSGWSRSARASRSRCWSVRGRLDAPARAFGDGHRKFRLRRASRRFHLVRLRGRPGGPGGPAVPGGGAPWTSPVGAQLAGGDAAWPRRRPHEVVVVRQRPQPALAGPRAGPRPR